MFALAACVLWFPLGRPQSNWLSQGVLALLVLGVLSNHFLGSCAVRHVPTLLAFGGASLLSAWFSRYADASFARGAGGLMLLLAFPAAQIVAREPTTLRWLQRAMQAAIIVCGIDIAWQYVFHHSLLGGIPEPADRWRFTGSLPNPNEVGFVALLLPLALVTPTTKGRASRLRSISIAAIATFGVLLTGSRTTLGGLLVGAWTRSWLGTRQFLRWSLVIVMVVGTVAWIGDLGSFRKRLTETLRPQQEMRLQTWRIALEAAVERPWLGHGPAVFFEVNEASRKEARPSGWETPPGGMPWVHNVPLELLVERGLLGCTFFAALSFLVIRDLRRGLATARIRPWAVGVAGSLAAFAAMSMLDLTLLKDWCLICLCISAGLASQFGASSAAESR